MYIFDQINGMDFSGVFIAAMDDSYFRVYRDRTYDSEALLTYFYFM